MHNENPTLEAKKRDRLGSRYSERIRKAGGLPAIVYGHGQEPVPVYFDAKTTLEHFVKGEKVFTIELDGGKPEMVLLKDLQYDYLGTRIIHADFARVDINERVNTRATIKLVGTAVGLRTAGAILTHQVTELEIECAVTNLPDSIEVDVTHLEAGENIHAGAVTLPMSTMKLLTDPDAIVAQITIRAEEPVDEEVVVSDGAEPEVITEKKEGEDKPAGD